MSKDYLIETKTCKMAELLSLGEYCVPWHQRYYDWDAKVQVLDLLEDVNEAAKHDRNCHFLGAIVLTEKGDKIWEINDGQQRFVTFSLICACLHHLFKDNSKPAQAKSAQRLLFDIDEWSGSDHINVDKLSPRLSPPEDDKRNFDLLIRGKKIGSNGKMVVAWKKIEEFVYSMSVEDAVRFFNFIISSLEVACLYVPKNLDPNAIFESLNARGKPLEDIDLLRNHIYSFFNDQEEETRRDTVHSNIENTWKGWKTSAGVKGNVHAKVGKYARCFFQCQYGYLPDNKFYRETKIKMANCFSTQKKGADYVYKLVEDFSKQENIGAFRAIDSPTHEAFVDLIIKASKTSRYPRNLRDFLFEMREYTVTYPILFALLNRYIFASDQEKSEWSRFVHECAESLASFVMRVALTRPKIEPSMHEKEFADYAKEIMNFNVPNSRDFIEFLKKHDERLGVIDDIDFKEKVSRMEKIAKPKRILFSMARFIQRDIPMDILTKLTLEHILPKSESYLGPGWKKFDERSHRAYVNMLGNLALLREDDNKPLKKDNASYTVKRKVFKNSSMLLTSEIAKKHRTWSPNIILSRQKHLADLAVEVWPINLSPR